MGLERAGCSRLRVGPFRADPLVSHFGAFFQYTNKVTETSQKGGLLKNKKVCNVGFKKFAKECHQMVFSTM
jgi:hypothetical protein